MELLINFPMEFFFAYAMAEQIMMVIPFLKINQRNPPTIPSSSVSMGKSNFTTS